MMMKRNDGCQLLKSLRVYVSPRFLHNTPRNRYVKGIFSIDLFRKPNRKH